MVWEMVSPLAAPNHFIIIIKGNEWGTLWNTPLEFAKWFQLHQFDGSSLKSSVDSFCEGIGSPVTSHMGFHGLPAVSALLPDLRGSGYWIWGCQFLSLLS